MTYKEATEYINSYTKSGKPVNDLSRFTALMNLLGNPQRKLRFVHVAGTNGKGSVCEYIACGLRFEGHKTGCFTSPYIVCLEERIRIDGRNIEQKRLAEICGYVAAAIKKSGLAGLSQFEIFTAIAFLYYYEEKCDYVVLETGIGGTLDCTNIITPALSVIATIDYDHTAILGGTLAEIAAHKAGIIKHGIPCVLSANQHAEALGVIREKAAAEQSRLVIPENAEITHSDLSGNAFTYKGCEYRTTMCGAHQVINAAAAIEAMSLLGVSHESIVLALAAAVIPARLQAVSRNPLTIIDGGHNPSGFASAMDAALREGCEITLLTGCLKTKSLAESYKKYLPMVKNAVFVDFFSPDAVSKERLAEIAASVGTAGATAENADEALKKCREMCNSGLILAAGSLYLAGALLRAGRF